MPDERKPDALRVPAHWGAHAGKVGQHRQLRDTFGPVLGAAQIYSRKQGHEYFVTAAMGDSLLFPTGHPSHPQPRYEWVEQPEFEGRPSPGLMFGYLVPGASPEEMG